MPCAGLSGAGTNHLRLPGRLLREGRHGPGRVYVVHRVPTRLQVLLSLRHPRLHQPLHGRRRRRLSPPPVSPPRGGCRQSQHYGGGAAAFPRQRRSSPCRPDCLHDRAGSRLVERARGGALAPRQVTTGPHCPSATSAQVLTLGVPVARCGPQGGHGSRAAERQMAQLVGLASHSRPCEDATGGERTVPLTRFSRFESPARQAGEETREYHPGGRLPASCHPLLRKGRADSPGACSNIIDLSREESSCEMSCAALCLRWWLQFSWPRRP